MPPVAGMEVGRPGELRPAGEADREPGGVSVDAYSEATEGFARLPLTERRRSASEPDSGIMSSTFCRLLAKLMVGDAAGRDCKGSGVDDPCSGDCIKRAPDDASTAQMTVMPSWVD